MQLVWPALDWNWPASQLKHDDWPALLWKVPERQLEHTLAPVDEYDPAAHKPVAEDSSVDPQ